MKIDDGLLSALAEPDRRQAAAADIAAALGCDELLLFVVDKETGVFVPAPGMPKTLRGGPLWRDFLHTCAQAGSHRCEVDLPSDSVRQATCLSTGPCLMTAIGAEPDPEGWEQLRQRMSLIGALFVAEQNLRLQQSQVAMAQEGASRAHALARALDAARAAAGDLNKRLREEHRRKDEFLAMLAHELRNPLAPLVNSVAILRRTGQTDQRVLPRILDVMERQILQLSRLVNDLLDVSRVSRGAITLQREPVLLADVLQSAMETVAPLMEGKRHRVTTAGLQHPIRVVGDRMRLLQVFANLLQNAGKYTPAGGEIALSLDSEAERAVVRVKDNGVGIPLGMQGPVFELFTQAHAAIDRSEGGLGIGLTLARTLVDLHGGDISVYSAGKDAGSTFTVRLPLAPAAADGAGPDSDVAPAAERPYPCGVRVLIVEDNPDIAATMAELLRHMTAQVEVAGDGEHALAAAKDFAPELVLVDISLPGMSGYDVATRLRAELPGRFRLVALTGYGAPADRERARRAGFDDHLVKPASPDALQQALQQCGAQA